MAAVHRVSQKRKLETSTEIAKDTREGWEIRESDKSGEKKKSQNQNLTTRAEAALPEIEKVLIPQDPSEGVEGLCELCRNSLKGRTYLCDTCNKAACGSCGSESIYGQLWVCYPCSKSLEESGSDVKENKKLFDDATINSLEYRSEDVETGDDRDSISCGCEGNRTKCHECLDRTVDGSTTYVECHTCGSNFICNKCLISILGEHAYYPKTKTYKSLNLELNKTYPQRENPHLKPQCSCCWNKGGSCRTF